MKAKIWLSELQFSDNTKIPLSKNDIVVIVGPNNSGKSASLKEAAILLRAKNVPCNVLKNIIIEKDSGEVDVSSFLESISTKHVDDNAQIFFSGYGFSALYLLTANYNWNNYKDGIGELSKIFINILTTEGRLKAANPPESIKLTTQPFKHPIHILQKNDNLEKRFNEYFRQAFGTDLIIHRNAGREVPLYVGEKPSLKDGEDRASFRYNEELEKLDLLHEQGDGMRSFVGVLLNVFIADYSILLIDEPEAFLHPPQARLLGKMLAKDLPSERQLFLATHSEDFLKGLLDAEARNLRIIRIHREGNINRVSVLDSSDIKQIWDDSLLRHSNVLSGLFHSKVIICESDSDCRFFSSMLSSLYDDSGDISPDILFIHCGGKHRIPTAIKALKKLNVQLKAISDFDVLNDITPLREIYEELGGVWSDIKNDWKIVKTEIEQKRPELPTSELKEQIEKILSSTKEVNFPKSKILEIQKALKKASAWSEAKAIGKAYIPNGKASQAFDRIQLKFKEKGLLILEVGELESFVKSVGNHGPKWVSDVLTKDLKNDPELEVARKFVEQLLEN